VRLAARLSQRPDGPPHVPPPQARAAPTAAQRVASLAAAACVLAGAPAQAASVSFPSLKDGATVSSPVHVDFGVSPDYAVEPAAAGLKDKSGHFHLFLDAEASCASPPPRPARRPGARRAPGCHGPRGATGPGRPGGPPAPGPPGPPSAPPARPRPLADPPKTSPGHSPHSRPPRPAAPPADPEGEAIPFDAQHLHFGKAQTSADVELGKGKHTLTLQFANALHESYGPGLAKQVTVTVN